MYNTGEETFMQTLAVDIIFYLPPPPPPSFCKINRYHTTLHIPTNSTTVDIFSVFKAHLLANNNNTRDNL